MKIADIRKTLKKDPLTRFAVRPSKSSTSVDPLYVIDADRQWWGKSHWDTKFKLASHSRCRHGEVMCAKPNTRFHGGANRDRDPLSFPASGRWRPDLIATSQIVLWDDAHAEVAARLEARANAKSEIQAAFAAAVLPVKRLQKLGGIGPGDPERHLICRGKRHQTSWYSSNREPSGVEITLEQAERFADLLEKERGQ